MNKGKDTSVVTFVLLMFLAVVALIVFAKLVEFGANALVDNINEGFDQLLSDATGQIYGK